MRPSNAPIICDHHKCPSQVSITQPIICVNHMRPSQVSITQPIICVNHMRPSQVSITQPIICVIHMRPLYAFITFVLHMQFLYFGAESKSGRKAWRHLFSFVELEGEYWMCSGAVLELSTNTMPLHVLLYFCLYLKEIDLSYTSVTSLPVNCFENLTCLRILNLRQTKITVFENIRLPENFKLDTLNIQGLVLTELQVNFFKGLTAHKSLLTSDFKLCCQQIRGDNISPSVCHAPDDAISTCQHIVGNFFKRVSVWIVGLLTIAGNGIVLIYRVMWSREKIFQTAYGLFVTGLAVSDLLMGVYLIIIAVVDVVYADVYVVYNESWRKSFLCHFSGFLSTLSSETSTFLIGLITLDRFISISYPFSAHDTSSSLKWKSFILTWVIRFVLALIPAVVPEWQIYSSNGLCLALPLDTKGSVTLPGWEFSMVVYVILNFVLFLFIALGQLLIFTNLIKKRNLPSMRQCSERRTQDINIAKKLAFVAVSDFMCRFPIGIMGILSLIGQEFDKETYAWMAVFVLPVNSALNPMIYTIPFIVDRLKRKTTSKS
ncbi:hypothetical protein Btru_007826 [Bulinus truncatus]|nr:hypothetical protein Btru_007826 [Bulinus truncatus]